MIDARLQPVLRAVYAAPARWMARRGFTADMLSVAGFLVGIAGSACVASRAFWTGLGLILLNRIMDGLDGAVARHVGPTDRGAFLDIALDFVFYATVPLAFAIADPKANALAAAALLFGFMGSTSSFLAFAAVEARRGLAPAVFPHKGIHYLGGITEGFETIAFFVAMTLWPRAFAPLAWVFAALCLVTTVTRWWWGWAAFSGPRQPLTGSGSAQSSADRANP
ncbi:CDP-alcohol phosphatidyltransferase family protein [Lichenihabitans psoromatis]|uniref:CDP-alcohol phosphatidyltransferase family protein n=1 Tax=Lichenihabitans psoromatis TaxID=2528642 RepID=UPI001035B000|nr:CDP-alcohol phosphatidyltransferase family protein [Lichenihabitans psoromatis]